MKIHFMPQQRLDGVVYRRVGPYQIDVNGELFDFSTMKDGDELIAAVGIKNSWFAHRVSVDGEHLCLSLFVPVTGGFNFNGVVPIDITVDRDGFIEPPVFKEVKDENRDN